MNLDSAIPDAAIPTTAASAPPRANILGVPIDAIDLPAAVNSIDGWITRRERHYVCVCNVHTVMECQGNEAIRQVYHQAGMVTPDGMPLVWVSRLMGFGGVGRVYGPDLTLETFARSLERGWSHFFYGGAPGVAEKLVARMTARFPGLKIAGIISPPFRPLTPQEDDADVRRINDSGADIVWVGIGAPRQEQWMASHRARLNAPVLIGIGAAFDFLSDTKRQAPRWMMRSGLEWLFRFACEPRRLWRRYLVYNSMFVWMMLMQFMGVRGGARIQADAE
ncbi:MAG TPA: WecB/TagA/CpsF family glycosyltransferase [Candidatus Binataceae bacterium]|nr:WecB/TagA/CpsF family glycosyltransferase [Candidatus Binataceae bacterium]